jgi:hypothetical protein
MRALRTVLVTSLLASAAATLLSPPALAASGVRGAGYVWANRPGAAGYYAPPSAYRYNTTHGTNEVVRNGVGSYQVRLPGLGVAAGNVQVSAYGSNDRCKVSSWNPNGADEFIAVRCYSPADVAADSRFTASFTSVVGAPAARQLAYAWVDHPEALTSTPAAAYQYDSAGGTLTVDRFAAGEYTVRVPGIIDPSSSDVQVTAYGAGAGYCKSLGWGRNAKHMDVAIACYAGDGSPSDQRFSMALVRRFTPLGLRAAQTADAYVFQPVDTTQAPFAEESYDNVSTSVPSTSRAGAGDYTITFPGVDLSRGVVTVVPVGATWDLGATSCAVVSWTPAAGVHVRCSDASGDPVDTSYSVSFTGPGA